MRFKGQFGGMSFKCTELRKANSRTIIVEVCIPTRIEMYLARSQAIRDRLLLPCTANFWVIYFNYVSTTTKRQKTLVRHVYY